MLARNRRSGEFFAMKRLKKSDIIKLRQVDHVISENTILADIEHPFLVSYRNLFGTASAHSDYIKLLLNLLHGFEGHLKADLSRCRMNYN